MYRLGIVGGSNSAGPGRHFSSAGEETLVGLAQHGNEEAFGELVLRVHEGCLNIATSILRNREDAQDEVQNALWKAYTHLSGFGQESKFSTWVTRIVINHCLMRYRRTHRVPFVSYDSPSSNGETYMAHEPTERETPEQGLAGTEIGKLVRKELGCIPFLLRVPLEMHYLNDIPLEDVAERLGITVAATKSRLHRAQRYLRERMLRHCGKRGPATLIRVA